MIQRLRKCITRKGEHVESTYAVNNKNTKLKYYIDVILLSLVPVFSDTLHIKDRHICSTNIKFKDD